MNTILIVSLIVVLFILIVGYNLIVQQRERVATNKRKEMAKYTAIIDATEELIGSANHIPFSKDLLVCLNMRIVDALKEMRSIAPKDRSLPVRISNLESQIEQLKQTYNGDGQPFKVPNTDRQAIALLQLVKRLKTVVRTEHSKGNIATASYVAELGRLEVMQIKINIENVIKRAREAHSKGQIGTAQQLLKKALELVATKNDSYSVQAREKLQMMFDELSASRAQQNNVEREQMEASTKNDIDELFQPKKKW
ncbi:hypothetical protein VST7929_01052 [Vibrio stylophorae]|uniref:DNA repair protein n=1 Tax=Vibrio stylophorae TaxID=659351 RepID=A0ABM8ZSB0_9VIBR|nr:DNA repair protein [Vibrio stylophorae]CAH0533190.1 hypothetical protein VST7929_01052 [Vibrio stylophorae]